MPRPKSPKKPKRKMHPRKKKEEGGALTSKNFREVAQKAIEKYSELNMAIDALLWSSIIGFYNAEIDRLNELLEWRS